LEQKERMVNSNVIDFSEILKRAYDKATNENDLTIDKLIEELKADLKNLVIG